MAKIRCQKSARFPIGYGVIEIEVASFHLSMEGDAESDKGISGKSSVQINGRNELNALTERIDPVYNIVEGIVQHQVYGKEFISYRIKAVVPDIHVVFKFILQEGIPGFDLQRVRYVRHILQLRNIGLVGVTA